MNKVTKFCIIAAIACFFLSVIVSSCGKSAGERYNDTMDRAIDRQVEHYNKYY